MGVTKFKIKPYRDCFKIWELQQYDRGYNYNDIKICDNKEQAKKFVEKRKKGMR